MRIIIDDIPVLAAFAVDLIADRVTERPDATIGLATGSSPIPIYEELARRCRAGELDLSQARFFALDEYVGLPGNHPMSYRYFLEEHVVRPCGIDPAQLRLLDGAAADPAAECAQYEDAIAAAGGIDLQILGIGHNGHLAFNEPTTSFGSRTRVVALTEETLEANARFFEEGQDGVPLRAVTQGIATILGARRLVLIGTGEGKAPAVHSAIEGPVASSCPASAMQLHRRATFLLDRPAAAMLSRADFYQREREVLAGYGR